MLHIAVCIWHPLRASCAGCTHAHTFTQKINITLVLTTMSPLKISSHKHLHNKSFKAAAIKPGWHRTKTMTLCVSSEPFFFVCQHRRPAKTRHAETTMGDVLGAYYHRIYSTNKRRWKKNGFCLLHLSVSSCQSQKIFVTQTWKGNIITWSLCEVFAIL